MKKNIEIWLIAAMAVISGNVWGTAYTWPAGTYYFEFDEFNNTDTKKIFKAYIFGTIGDADRAKVTLLNGQTNCNSNVDQKSYQEYWPLDSSTPLDVIAIELTADVSVTDNTVFMQFGTGSTQADNWTYGWKSPTQLGINSAPTAFSTGVYYLKVTRDGDNNYTAAWQTSGSTSLPACSSGGGGGGGGGSITLTYQSNDDDKGSVTSPTASESTVSSGTSITLTATPEDGFIFLGWKDNTGKFISNSNPYSFTITESVNYTGYFGKDATIDGCANCFKYDK